jgi:hypothetical protein
MSGRCRGQLGSENTTFHLPEEKRKEKSTRDFQMSWELVAGMRVVKSENGYNVSFKVKKEERTW